MGSAPLCKFASGLPVLMWSGWAGSSLRPTPFPFASYMVDAADPEKIEASKNELHNLLDKPQLQGIPVRAPPANVLPHGLFPPHRRAGLPA